MSSASRSKVYVVDDSRIVRERLIGLLSELPHIEVVGQADLPVDAIAGIRNLKPTAVILDISMPGGGGLAVLEAIQGEQSAPMVIMLTNFAQEHYRKRCFQLGAKHFFDKSTEFQKVISVLEELAPRKRRSASRPLATPVANPVLLQNALGSAGGSEARAVT